MANKRPGGLISEEAAEGGGTHPDQMRGLFLREIGIAERDAWRTELQRVMATPRKKRKALNRE
jgi:hypothetical protein